MRAVVLVPVVVVTGVVVMACVVQRIGVGIAATHQPRKGGTMGLREVSQVETGLADAHWSGSQVKAAASSKM